MLNLEEGMQSACTSFNPHNVDFCKDISTACQANERTPNNQKRLSKICQACRGRLAAPRYRIPLSPIEPMSVCTWACESCGTSESRDLSRTCSSPCQPTYASNVESPSSSDDEQFGRIVADVTCALYCPSPAGLRDWKTSS